MVSFEDCTEKSSMSSYKNFSNEMIGKFIKKTVDISQGNPKDSTGEIKDKLLQKRSFSKISASYGQFESPKIIIGK